MNKTILVLMLIMAALVLVSGCSTKAQQNQNEEGYYVPANSYGGCGVAPAEDTNTYQAVQDVVVTVNSADF